MQNSYELSVLITARSEEFLERTIQAVLENKNECTEIIVGIDGDNNFPLSKTYKDVTVLEVHDSLGQRGMTNQLCALSRAKYVMKLDGHCDIEEDFDIKMLKGFEVNGDNTIQVPIMRNLWAYDWKCPNDGKRTYQDKGNICPVCGGEMQKKILWRAKSNPQSVSYCFDTEPRFQYFPEYTKTNEYKEDLKTGYTKSMSLQGSCFMLTREKYHDLNVCDEEFGSWGSQGIELAMKFWLSGGEVIVNHHTWYAHMFRTKSKTFGFPYKQDNTQVESAKTKAKDFFFNNKWDKQVHTLGWVLDKFAPVRGWSNEDMEAQKARETGGNMV